MIFFRKQQQLRLKINIYNELHILDEEIPFSNHKVQVNACILFGLMSMASIY